jgi:hypothetical protein
MKLIRNTEGKVYAVQVGRLVVYVDRVRYYPTWYGGHMINWRGQRLLADHIWWRFCWAGAR